MSECVSERATCCERADMALHALKRKRHSSHCAERTTGQGFERAPFQHGQLQACGLGTVSHLEPESEPRVACQRRCGGVGAVHSSTQKLMLTHTFLLSHTQTLRICVLVCVYERRPELCSCKLCECVSRRFNANRHFPVACRYMAPEVQRGQAISPAADMWSFGATMWEMSLRRKFPSRDATTATAQQQQQQLQYKNKKKSRGGGSSSHKHRGAPPRWKRTLGGYSKYITNPSPAVPVRRVKQVVVAPVLVMSRLVRRVHAKNRSSSPPPNASLYHRASLCASCDNGCGDKLIVPSRKLYVSSQAGGDRILPPH